MSICALKNVPCPCLWHPLILIVFYVSQCLRLAYQQHHQKTHYYLISLNCHHMKNNIRYKGNINNISQWCYFAWENLQWGFCDVDCSFSSFHFCIFISILIFISFLIFIFLLFFICLFSSFICFSTSFLTLLWTIVGFYTYKPILYFQPSPSQSDSWRFHFQPFRYLLTASATVLSGHFLPSGNFCLAFLHWHFT